MVEPIQADHSVRVVALANLEAMCGAAGGVARRFWIESVSESRVRIGYSNPDEYGNECEVYAYLPSWKESPNLRYVALVVTHMIGGRDEENRGCGGWQMFDEAILSAQKLWRKRDGEWIPTFDRE